MEDPVQGLIREFQEILNYYAEERDSLLALIKQGSCDELSEHPATRRLLGHPAGCQPKKIHELEMKLCAGMLVEHPKYQEMAERYHEQLSRIETQMLLPGATNLKLLIPEYLRAGLDYLSYSAGSRFIGDVCDSGYVHDLELETDTNGLKLAAKTAPLEFFPRVKWINFCWQQLLNGHRQPTSDGSQSTPNTEAPSSRFGGKNTETQDLYKQIRILVQEHEKSSKKEPRYKFVAARLTKMDYLSPRLEEWRKGNKEPNMTWLSAVTKHSQLRSRFESLIITAMK